MPKKMKSLVYEQMGICYIDLEGENAICVEASRDYFQPIVHLGNTWSPVSSDMRFKMSTIGNPSWINSHIFCCSPTPTLVSVLVTAFGPCALLMPIKMRCWKTHVWTFQATRGSNSNCGHGVGGEVLLVTLSPSSRKNTASIKYNMFSLGLPWSLLRLEYIVMPHTDPTMSAVQSKSRLLEGSTSPRENPVWECGVSVSLGFHWLDQFSLRSSTSGCAWTAQMVNSARMKNGEGLRCLLRYFSWSLDDDDDWCWCWWFWYKSCFILVLMVSIWMSGFVFISCWTYLAVGILSVTLKNS